MKKDIYIFGSAMRGEVQKNSDIDVLVIIDDIEKKHDFPNEWSVYSEETIKNYYELGRLFAWHLYLESKCIFSNRPTPFLHQLSKPNLYTSHKEDFKYLSEILFSALDEIKENTNSAIFEIGVIYTALRDIAMIASTKTLSSPCFSRYAPYKLPIGFPISREIYELAIQARLQSSRGLIVDINQDAVTTKILTYPIKEWVKNIEELL